MSIKKLIEQIIQLKLTDTGPFIRLSEKTSLTV